MHNWSHFLFYSLFSLLFSKKCFLPLVFISLTHVELFPSGKLGKSPGTMETKPRGNTISYLLVLALWFLYLRGVCGDSYSLLVVILSFKGKANADITAWKWHADMQPSKLGIPIYRSNSVTGYNRWRYPLERDCRVEALSLTILTEGQMWGNIAPWLKIEMEEFTIKTEVKTNFSY